MRCVNEAHAFTTRPVLFAERLPNQSLATAPQPAITTHLARRM